MRNRLIEDRQRVAHRAFRRARDQRERLGFGRHFLLLADRSEMLGQETGLDTSEIEALAP